MSIDPKSIIIGALSAALAFSILGTNGNDGPEVFDTIVCNRIFVKAPDGRNAMMLNGDFREIRVMAENMSASMSCGPEGPFVSVHHGNKGAHLMAQ